MKNELEAQKTMYERCIQEFRALLRGSRAFLSFLLETNELYKKSYQPSGQLSSRKESLALEEPIVQQQKQQHSRTSSSDLVPNSSDIKQRQKSREELDVSACIQKRPVRKQNSQPSVTFTEL